MDLSIGYKENPITFLNGFNRFYYVKLPYKNNWNSLLVLIFYKIRTNKIISLLIG